MAKRRTIGRDPLAEPSGQSTYSAEIVAIPIPGVAAAAIPQTIPDASDTPEVSAPVIVISAKARRAVGGRVEIFGGDLGSGVRVIWPTTSNEGIGFVAPSGRNVDLTRELDAVTAWPDSTEHRYLSAIGWAWVFGSLGGIVGLLAGGGLRLLEPKRIIVSVALSDGATFFGRTDHVTVAGLTALAETRRTARA